ncbi:hypothetical protein PROVALCAL_00775 [Providencia alcalifaciens DSM 30120]|uniref:Uncharacterized protein n=1 Tax=Providencia alcalifaciens DSM 30120 TaxID=520999 RepID=B6XBR4_9GAMM|nr:hypothetical protein PROVALCAL_00775 [Providencia alcalifaciens DSM 30120]
MGLLNGEMLCQHKDSINQFNFVKSWIKVFLKNKKSRRYLRVMKGYV